LTTERLRLGVLRGGGGAMAEETSVH
jgi:hypothetical protein